MSGYRSEDDVAPGDEVSAWLSRLEDARKDDGMHRYEERCRIIRKKYLYEGSALVRTRKYQMLWSNIQTMQSAIYAKPPHAVVSRRFRDQDPIARTATEVLERAVNFTFDAADFDTEFKMVRDDFLLYARGVARVYYEPEYETENDENEDISDAESENDTAGRLDLAQGNAGDSSRSADSFSAGSDDARAGAAANLGLEGADLRDDRLRARSGIGGSGGANQGGSDGNLKFENVRIRFVQRQDFRHQPSRVWSECQWVAFRAFLTRDEITKRFGEKIGKEIALDADPMEEEDQRDTGAGAATVRKAAVWEIWDKAKNEVCWVSPGFPDILETGAPYLVLDGFYPCPRPALGTVATDSLVPVPDFVFYQDQAEEIDQLTARIGALSDALKLVGFYPAGPQGEGAPEIEKAMSPGFENKLIAVQGYSQFLEAGGGKGAPITWLPVEQVSTVLEGCVKLRQQLVEDVYQIIGISDIMRGATDPQETEGAQQLKAQYGGTRIKDRQEEIARFCRDVARLVGQVIAQYCSPATILEMTNMKLPTQLDLMMAQLQAQRQASVAAMQMPSPPMPAPQGQAASPVQPGVIPSSLAPQYPPRPVVAGAIR
ncbi:MAG TPA: hypothetical protein VH114_01755 [Candidatus Acidoferrum sp.]|nr:hypothetical protein [Candidatus Acidoferrum sp.]